MFDTHTLFKIRALPSTELHVLYMLSHFTRGTCVTASAFDISADWTLAQLEHQEQIKQCSLVASAMGVNADHHAHGTPLPGVFPIKKQAEKGLD